MKNIKRVLIDAGMPQHLQGFEYTLRAVQKVVDDPKILHGITKELYPQLAREFDTRSRCIERNIRHAKIATFNNITPDMVHKIFGNTIDFSRDVPTNGHFIAAIANYVLE